MHPILIDFPLTVSQAGLLNSGKAPRKFSKKYTSAKVVRAALAYDVDDIGRNRVISCVLAAFVC